MAGSPLILTVTLKDAQGNPAPGQAGTLTAETVKAANAELKGTWPKQARQAPTARPTPRRRPEPV
ncbi:hypothetical protein CEQ31_026625 [Serratia odorifera]|uniref:hypothetical protein n=1 Tax=Serratia odorifera TaxID=618 RepID=UPI000B4E8116|nr:hypothetical protein [Serratia odorifera]PNK82399.1 hypothetical protein CEQ31_026625 [Serratia odorifera]